MGDREAFIQQQDVRRAFMENLEVTFALNEAGTAYCRVTLSDSGVMLVPEVREPKSYHIHFTKPRWA